MSIQAIPTRYDGHIFRSRLEARYAVFFNVLGFRWLYELEGFQLPSGKKYLPDFFLQDHNCYAEVKPVETKDERWDEFCKEHSLLILVGKPNYTAYDLMDKDGTMDVCFVPAGGKYFPFWCAGDKNDQFMLDDLAEAIIEANSYHFE